MLELMLFYLLDLIASTSELQKLSSELYKYNLLKALVVAFKHEYGHLRNGWEVAVDLVKTFWFVLAQILDSSSFLLIETF
jgi:hypothetical protein